LTKHLPDDGKMQCPLRGAPIKVVLTVRVVGMPDHPGGEEAVEEGLHDRRTEEFVAAFVREVDAERLFDSTSEIGEAGGIRSKTRPCIACVGGEESRDLLRRVQRGVVEHDALYEIEKSVAVEFCRGDGIGGGLPERSFVSADFETFEFDCLAAPVLDQKELAVVGDEDVAVLAEVLRNLFAGGNLGDALVRRFRFDHATVRGKAHADGETGILREPGLRRDRTVRNASAKILSLHDAANLRLQLLADSVEQRFERAVVGRLGCTEAGRSNRVEVGEILLQCVHRSAGFYCMATCRGGAPSWQLL
jgi:hypothetical protein